MKINPRGTIIANAYPSLCNFFEYLLQNMDLDSSLSHIKDLLLHFKPTNMLGFFMGIVSCHTSHCVITPNILCSVGKPLRGREKQRGLKELRARQDEGGEVKSQKEFFPT